MEINKRKNLIANALRIFLLSIIIFGVVIVNREINKITDKSKDNLKAEVEQQTIVPDGYTGIYTSDDLINIANDLTASYILMADIDMTGVEWTPIGSSSSSAFTGIFDGNLYTISNLNIESASQYVGMFGYVSGGTVKNFTIENKSVKSTYTNTSTSSTYSAYIGGLVGYGTNATIENINVIGTINIENTEGNNKVYIGGIVGYSTGTITNVNITGNVTAASTSGYIYAGGLVGQSSGAITNVGTTVNVTSTSTTGYIYAGGLAGYSGAISDSYSTGNVTITTRSGETYTGGLVGSIQSKVTVNNTYATGNIEINSSTGRIYSGGLIGYIIYYPTISLSYSTGDVIVKPTTDTTTRYEYIGGLIGYIYNNSKGTNCIVNINQVYSTGNIKTETDSSNIYTGGLIGYAATNTASKSLSIYNNHIKISNAYSTTKTSLVKGYAGGLIGYAVGKRDGTTNYYNMIIVTNTYAIGQIEGGTTTGGLIATGEYCTVTNSYWSSETTGQYTSATTGEKSKTFQSMIYKDTYTNWDFDTIWQIEEGETLPYLLNMDKPEEVIKTAYTYTAYEGKGTEESPFLIKTAEQLQGVKNDLGAYYKLANDIEWNSNEVFEPIGDATTPFTGTIDGDGYKIIGLNIESSEQYVGAFGYVSSGTIKNLTLENENVKSTYTNTSASSAYSAYIGGLVGYGTNSTIENVNIVGISSIENITEKNYIYVGGLVGYGSSTTIENSSSGAEVIAETTTGYIYAGGLAGYSGAISDSYSTGNMTITTISGETYTGGLVGSIQSKVTVNNTYATGNIEINSSTGKIYSGGLIGYIRYYPTISLSYSTGDVIVKPTTQTTTRYEYIGGLIGHIYNYSSSNSTNCIANINQVYSTGNIKTETDSSNIYTGGLIGYAATDTASKSLSIYNNHIKISNAYSTTKTSLVKGYAGGLIGYAVGKRDGTTNYYNMIIVTNTYAIGQIEGGTTTGGLIATGEYCTVTNSYWSPELTEVRTSATTGEQKKTIQDMLSKDTYTNWDFDTIWSIEENSLSMPYLKDIGNKDELLKENFNYVEYEGEGTEENPYIIDSMEKFEYIDKFFEEKYFILEQDLDAKDIENFDILSQITSPFMGILDGNNKKISNLSIESSENYIGIFKANEGTIKNLTIENININAIADKNIVYIGGVVAYNKGNIQNVNITGTINNNATTTDAYIGKVIGYNEGNISKIEENAIINNIGSSTNAYIGNIVGCNNLNINRAKSQGTINSNGAVTNGYIGGIVGLNNKNTKLSYNIGNINSENIENLSQGGIVGKNENIIFACYSKGNQQANATSKLNIGGVAGENTATISETYSIDMITKQATTINEGGIAGQNTGTIDLSYWSIEDMAEGTENGTYETMEDMKSQSTYSEWNFEYVWYIDEGIDTPELKVESNYFDDSFWEWHTRTTTDDQAYNGRHIEIIDAIKFYGYWNISYKDFLYKDYIYAGKKIFTFSIDETEASYHTLDGAGFIFNANKENDKLSGYILLIRQSDVCIYRIDDVDVNTFETTSDTTVATYGTLIASVEKNSSTIHNLIIEVSPTKVIITDNDEEIFDVDLDYSKHVGESFGLISSYVEHACSILTTIEFKEFKLEVDDYIIEALKTDMNSNPLKGAKFQVKDENEEIVREGTTDENGIFQIRGLEEGIYTIEETEAPEKYALSNSKQTFKVTSEGKAVDINTEEEINIEFKNELLEMKIVNKKINTEILIEGSTIGLYDIEGNPVLNSEGNHITGVTDKDGTVVFTNIAKGKYKYGQITVPKGYALNTNKYECELHEDGSVTFEDDTEGIIYNDIIRVDVTIKKYVEGTTSPLSGALIGLVDEQGNVIQINEVEQKGQTDSNGEIIFKSLEAGIYRYKEINPPIGYILNENIYEFTVDEEGNVTFGENDGIITNEKEKTDITVTKKWVDNENSAGKRPTQIILKVMNGEQEVERQAVSASDNWSHTFTLNKYNDDAEIISYTVDEEAVNSGDLYFYTKSIEGTTITNTFTVPSETVSYTVNKVWVDTDAQAVHRPESIILQAKNGEEVVSQETVTTNSNLTYTFTNLPKYDSNGDEIVYTAGEVTDSKFYTSSISGETVTNAFTVPNETIGYTINKVWVDTEAQAVHRPASIKVQILNGTQVVQEQEISNTQASVTFSNLPKYDENGNEITYTIKEVEVNSGDLKFYTSSIEGTTITNTFTVPSETVSYAINKVWVDTEAQAVHRPESIKVQILNGTQVAQEQEISKTETSVAFNNLPKYDENGNEITYTIKEAEVNSGDLKFYTSSIEGTIITNTFTVPSETVGYTINKIWVDTEAQAVHRPASIKVQILNGTQVVQEQEISNTQASVTFSNLPKYDENGNEITYTIKEVEVNSGDLKFYTSSIEGTTITNTFTVPSETVSYSINKVWVDTEAQAAHRPESIVLQVKNGENVISEETVTASTNWSHTFTNLPKYDENGNEIIYTTGEVTDSKFYTSSISGTTVTNTFTVPNETVSYTINKVWVDTQAQAVHRPSSIKIQILNGTQIVQEQEISNTQASVTFNDLAKYDADGNEIVYTIAEAEVNVGDLEYYTSSIEGTTITNTFTLPSQTIDYTVNKVWVDTQAQAAHRPASIKIQILNGTQIIQEQEILNTQTSVTFSNLPKRDENGNEIAYTIAEAEVNSGDLKFYTSSIEGNTITNTFTLPNETISYTVNKVWVDTEAQAVHRPSSIILQAKKGEEVVREEIVTASTNWAHTFTNLPKYDENGNEVIYTIGEAEVNSGDLKFYTSSIEGNTITNKFTVPNETISYTVNKVWIDTEVQAVHRPASIKVQILNGTQIVQEQEISKTQTSVKFNDLPKYNADGNEIVYTIAEAEVNSGDLKFYTSSIEGATITNTFVVPNDTVDITVQKEWIDNDNSAGKRPSSVIIVAKNGTLELGQVQLTKENAITNNNNIWEGKITNLAKYDENGNEITYAIDEKEVNSGDLFYYQKSIEGNKVINTLEIKKATYRVEHYRRNLDIEVESYDCEVEYFEGEVGQLVTAIPKEYGGFVENVLHPNRIPSGIVLEDNSLVLRLYYDREQYSISYELNNGVATGTLTKQYMYGQEIFLSRRVEKDGYEFAGWYDNAKLDGNVITKIKAGERGNKVFYAKWIQKSLFSSTYNIDEVKGQISEISPKTTVNNLLENLSSTGTIKIYDLKGNLVSSNNLVGTGYTIKIENEDQTYEYQIAVKGDLDGNGKVTATDLSMLNHAVVKTTELTEVQKTAIDFDANEKVSITDLSIMNKYLVGKISF